MNLIHFSAPDNALAQPFNDLDMLRILILARPQLTESELSDWTLRAFENDPDELSARYKLFQDLKDKDLAEEAYHKLRSFIDEQEKASRTADDLHDVLYSYRVLNAFLALIEALENLCASGEGHSPRLGQLKDLVAEIRKDPAFLTIESVVREVPTVLPFPSHIYVGLNARETGDTTDIGIIKDDTSETTIQALLDVSAPTASSESLFPEMPYTRAQYGTHFEEYLLQHYSKHYHSEITKALKLLQGVAPLRSPELIELADSLEYLVIGLSLCDLFQKAGYGLTIPDPNGEELTAEGLQYPDLALHMNDLEGKQVTLSGGSSTLITGANHSGKTSYLKTIGQSLVLAQFGFPVPAVSFRFRPFKKFYTLFSTGEDSSMSVSRMGVEIQRLSQIMQSATEQDLVLINEPMTSTNPIEAVSICSDLMQHFLNKHITHLVVTHLYDIYYLLKTRLSADQEERFTSLITLSEFSEEKGMVHSYRLMESQPLGNSYAMETAKSFQITLEDLLEDPALRAEASSYCRRIRMENIYESADAQSGKEA